jgi:hypothetical protein
MQLHRRRRVCTMISESPRHNTVALGARVRRLGMGATALPILQIRGPTEHRSRVENPARLTNCTLANCKMYMYQIMQYFQIQITLIFHAQYAGLGYMYMHIIIAELENENDVCHTLINIYYMATQIKRPDTLCFTEVHVHVARRACKAYMYLITCRIVPK